MPQSSTVAARCAALGTSIGQVIPDISTFARRLRNARHELNDINHHLLVIKTALGVAQDDFSNVGSKLPTCIVEAVSCIIDSCDDTSERLHKAFLKLSCCASPKDSWQSFKDGPLINLRHDLDASKVALELALDYIALFGQQDTLDSVLRCYVSQLITASDELLKRTDSEEIYINQTARDRLSSLLHAIRLLRSCITAIPRDGATSASQSISRTSTPRPDSLEPTLGDERRSGRKSPSHQVSPISPASQGIGTWLANVPSFQDEPLRISVAAAKRVFAARPRIRPLSRRDMTPSQGTFYTDDGVSSGRTLVPSEARLRKSRSWCSEMSKTTGRAMKATGRHAKADTATTSSSNLSIFHKRITSDKIAITKSNRKELDMDHRMAFDRILANVPIDATASEVERILWEGASPMAVHPDFGYFFIRAACEMSTDVLQTLVEFGADVTKTSDTHERCPSAMHAAALGGHLSTVKFLASKRCAIDIPNRLGETPLHLAIKVPRAYGVVRYLLDSGADVNHEANSGQTPLQVILKWKKVEGRERSRLIELLLAHGAYGEVSEVMDARRGDSKGRSVLGL